MEDYKLIAEKYLAEAKEHRQNSIRLNIEASTEQDKSHLAYREAMSNVRKYMNTQEHKKCHNCPKAKEKCMSIDVTKCLYHIYPRIVLDRLIKNVQDNKHFKQQEKDLEVINSIDGGEALNNLYMKK